MEVSKLRARTGWFVFALCLFIYLLTLCPTVYWDDAGELIATCYTLGIPHPPGHPLYALLGKIFTFLPIGSIAWRVNFMSALFGALTGLLVYRMIIELLDENDVWIMPAAVGGALFFPFAPTVWEHATVAETSTLHSFFMVLLTLLAFRLASGRLMFKSESKSLCFFAFLYGLSLTNHVAGVFFFPAFAYIVLRTFGRRIFSPRLLGGMILFFCCGLLVYAYLPVRSLSDPPIDWGNPETLRNFMWVITAKQYVESLISEPEPVNIISYAGLRVKDIIRQLSIPGCVLGCVGVVTLYRRNKDFVIFSVLVIGALFYIGLNSAFISAYFVPAIALMAVWIGAGIWQILIWLERRVGIISSPSAARMITIPLCVLVSVSFLVPLGANFRDMDRSDSRYALRYGEMLLAGLPEGSMLFTTKADTSFILWYLMYCENRRTDLQVLPAMWLLGDEALRSQIVEQYPGLVFPRPATVADYVSRTDQTGLKKFLIIQSIMDANYGRRPIFWGDVTSGMPFEENLIPLGYLFRYSAQPVALDDETLLPNRLFWERELDCLSEEPAMGRNKVALEVYPAALNNQGLMFEHRGRDDLARWAIERALDFNPDYPVSRYNLGRLEARAGNYEKAVGQYQRAVAGNPYMAVGYYNLGNAYVNLKRFDDAFIAYREAVHIDGFYYEALTAMGRLYVLVGHNEDAVEKFQQALEIEPEYVFALRGLASAYVNLGRLEEAKEAIDKALEIEPESASALLTRARYYARIGNTEGAMDALKRCVECGGNGYLEEARADEYLMKLTEHSPPREDQT